jgi:hypothetical protein
MIGRCPWLIIMYHNIAPFTLYYLSTVVLLVCLKRLKVRRVYHTYFTYPYTLPSYLRFLVSLSHQIFSSSPSHCYEQHESSLTTSTCLSNLSIAKILARSNLCFKQEYYVVSLRNRPAAHSTQ